MTSDIEHDESCPWKIKYEAFKDLQKGMVPKDLVRVYKALKFNQWIHKSLRGNITFRHNDFYKEMASGERLINEALDIFESNQFHTKECSCQ